MTTARRMSRHEWGLAMARTVALRADCTRRQVGAIVFDEHWRTVSTGYNGAPAGRPGCLSDGACPRGRMSYGELAAEGNYDNCVAIHAEANALLYAPRSALIGATMFITDAPCASCLKLIMGAGVAMAFWPGGWWDSRDVD